MSFARAHPVADLATSVLFGISYLHRSMEFSYLLLGPILWQIWPHLYDLALQLPATQSILSAFHYNKQKQNNVRITRK